MPIVVLLAYLVIFAVPVSAAPADWADFAWMLPAYLAGVAVLSFQTMWMSLRALRGTTGLPVRLQKRHRLHGYLVQTWILLGLAGLVYEGLPQRLADTWPMLSASIALQATLVLLPYVAAMLLHWTLQYPFHVVARRRQAQDALLAGETPPPFWSRRDYLAFNTRHQILFIAVPITLILLGRDVLGAVLVAVLGATESAMFWAEVGSLPVTLLVFLLAPAVLVRVWKTAPLPADAMRQELDDIARRLGIRYRQIRLWNTGGVIANAAAMGLWSRIRYVLLSDALLNEMPPIQIQAIFGHELAHIRHHHIFYSGLFALSAALWTNAVAWGAAWMGLPPAGQQILLFALLGACWYVGFGFVSRRFERQSDVVGAWSVGQDRPPTDPAVTTVEPYGINAFIQALAEVARLNGIETTKRNWRHGRISERIAYLRDLPARSVGREEIDAVVRRIKLVLWGAVLGGTALLALQLMLSNASAAGL